jgi:hypothetical protein
MKLLATLLLLTLNLAMVANAPAKTRGLGLGVGAFDGEFGVQLRKDVWLGGDISQISGQASIIFASKTAFRLDADYHFILNPGKPGRFYPLVGVDFTFNSDHAKFGINAGGRINFKLTEKTAAFGEGKYVFGDWDGWTFVGGIRF